MKKPIVRVQVIDRQTQETYQGSFANDVNLKRLKVGSSVHIRIDSQQTWLSIFKVRGWVRSLDHDNVIVISEANKKFQITAIG